MTRRYIFASLLLSATINCAAYGSVDSQCENALMRKGTALDAASKYPEAVSIFSKAITEFPGIPKGYYWRGLSNFHQAKYGDAIADLTKAIEINPEFQDAYFIRAKAYSDSGQLDKAVQDFDWVINHDPKFKEVYMEKARAYKKFKNEVLTKSCKEQAIRLKGRSLVAEGEPASPDFSNYMPELQRRVREVWEPPRRAVSKSAIVYFKIHRDLSISDAKVKETSDDLFFDRDALDAIKHKIKLPPFPPGSEEENEIEFAFDYNNFFSSSDRQKVFGRSIAMPSPEHKLFEKARDLAAEQKYREAVGAYLKVLELYGKRDQDEEISRKVKRSLEGLGYSYHKLSVQERENPKEQMKLLHEALYYYPDCKDAREDIVLALKLFGKDADKQDDRVSFGDELKATGDLHGAAVEYQEALKIKDDKSIQEKLKSVKNTKDGTSQRI